jgi:hypothetical protein
LVKQVPRVEIFLWVFLNVLNVEEDAMEVGVLSLVAAPSSDFRTSVASSARQMQSYAIGVR